MHTESTAETLPTADDNCVTLDTPIKRGTSDVSIITVRKPLSGELRGIQLMELLNLDVASLTKVIPRISTPSITAQEINAMDPADLLALGTKIVGFLVRKQDRMDASHVA